MSVATQELGKGASDRAVIASRPFSLATAALVAAALLLYTSGSFVVADLFSGKRVCEALLMLPLGTAAAYYWVHRPRCFLDPLVWFVLVKTAIEISLRQEWIWVLDDVGTLFALTVINAASRRSVIVGVKTVVAVAGTFAIMGCVQWFLFYFNPDWIRYGLTDDNGVIRDSVQHPVALLGMFADESHILFGHAVVRLQSFATEPSLNVVYFLMPASLALLLRTRLAIALAMPMVLFGVLSLSGSVFLTLAFAALWFLLVQAVPMKFAFLYGLPGILAFYIYGVSTFGLDPLFRALAFFAQYGDFLNKGESLVSRSKGAVTTLSTALESPFGAAVHPNLPGPWLINGTAEAGWLGAAFLLLFLAKLATQVTILNRHASRVSMRRLASVLLLGVLSTVVAFNDYQMSNYAGLVMLGFIFRLIGLHNEADNPTGRKQRWTS
jgi:hypothetical protein